MRRIYLDNAATTPTDPRVIEAMRPYWSEMFGNPSSIHRYGQEALNAVEENRSRIAESLGGKTSEIVFTSGGTEADNAAIKGVAFALKEKGNHIITSCIEHHAVLHSCDFLASQGFSITALPVDGCGIVDPSDVKRAVTGKTILISIMHANNEIGSIQPVKEIGLIARERSIPFHTDAVQSYGHIPIDVNEMNIDLLSLSGHKFNGPKGIGVLYVREGTRLIPLLDGGAQENGRRSSTHNVPGIAGLGKASEIAFDEMEEVRTRTENLRSRLWEGLRERCGYIHLNGHPVLRLPNNLNVSIENVEGEALLMNLDMEGIAASSGSACSSGSAEPSHVLTALGLSPELCRGSLRLSLGKSTTEEDIDRTIDVLCRSVAHLRSLSAF